MPADLKLGLASTLYATWLHNSLPVALFFLIGLAALLLVFRPRRSLVLFLLGFILLFLEFEYRKHFGKDLEEQTITSIIAGEGHIRARSFLEDFFQKLIPFLLWASGWGAVALGMIFLPSEKK